MVQRLLENGPCSAKVTGVSEGDQVANLGGEQAQRHHHLHGAFLEPAADYFQRC